jgi:serine/threonine protein kinase
MVKTIQNKSTKALIVESIVKLRNYIIHPNSKLVKICDFSLARQFALADASGEQEGEQLVKGGATLAYISPEQTTRIPG